MLRFEKVSYTYPYQNSPAVREVSLEVRPGELVLCTGASGCGKSTLIRLANGLCPHYFKGTLQGRVLVDGVDCAQCTIAELACKAGTLFQDPEQQFFALNVEDELAFALEWQGRQKEDMQKTVDGVIRDFDLEDLREASLQVLSEGEKQKVGLAALCAQNPRVLILDEPSANLDPEATTALAQKLLHLKRQGMALFVVDHRLYWLEGIADRVLVMQEGRVVAQGGFAMLRDDTLRQACGLRASHVPDVRHSLPACGAEGTGNSVPVVEVTGLTHAYTKGRPLYTDAAFTLAAGITALLGDNGTGKTTLARLLAGLSTPDKGTVALKDVANPENMANLKDTLVLKGSGVLKGSTNSEDSVPLKGTVPLNGSLVLKDKERLRRTGIVLQNADHQLHMRTVLEEVQTSLLLSRKIRSGKGGANADGITTAQELLELFHMGDLGLRHPQSLSGGQKQRLVIACALAKHPQLLVLDEPTSGLDGRNMEQLVKVLEHYGRQGMCVLLITHDLELLHRVCATALRLPFSEHAAFEPDFA